MYRAFVSEWLPTHPEVGMRSAFLSRGEVLEMVLETFDKREQYNRMLDEHQRRLRKDYIWRRVAAVLPLEGKELGQAMVALKTHLAWNDGVPALVEKHDRSVEKLPALEKDIVDETLIPWVLANWQEAVAQLCA